MKDIIFVLIVTGLVAIGVISNYLLPEYITAYIIYTLITIIIGLTLLPDILHYLKSKAREELAKS